MTGETPSAARSWIATGVVVAVLALAVILGSRLINLAFGAMQIPEHLFLRDWSAEYSERYTGADAMFIDEESRGFGAELAAAAAARASEPTIYDPAYVSLWYPDGDVSPDRGVCTDLVVRSFRDVGVDLQQGVHIDMSLSFELYPTIWGSTRPDSNIDHRRVPNLMVFFDRFGYGLPTTSDPLGYLPGDVVTWDLGGGMTHIGIVTAEEDEETGRPLVAHHIGGHPTVDDVLFAWDVIGHFRYHGRDIQ